jgi:outer membrane immunogenic protein
VTGGASHISFSGCDTFLGPCFTNFGDSRWGWTIGAGLAYAFSSNLIGRVEYLYSNFGTDNISDPDVGGGIQQVKLNTQSIRAGLSWKFGDPWGKSPVVAKY